VSICLDNLDNLPVAIASPAYLTHKLTQFIVLSLSPLIVATKTHTVY